MWKPPERIRHVPQGGRWPSRAEAAASPLFSPLDAGRVRLAQRTWVPAMVPWRASPDGEVTDAVLAWYRRFAQGRPGALVVEATGVRDVPSGPLLRIGDNRFTAGLTRLVETVRDASQGETRLYIQLIDFLAIRRRPTREAFLQRFLALTDAHRVAFDSVDGDVVRARLLALDPAALESVLSAREREDLTRGYRERVTDLHLPHIQGLPSTLPDAFARAAARAEAAGFDGVELHFAHAYTLASFLSRLNTRTDGYGGDLAGRARLPLEVFDAVRGAVSTAFAVGCRMLADECLEGGSEVGDAVAFAEAFARAGLDFISLSRGGKFEDAAEPRVGEAIYPYTGRSGYECMPQVLSDAQGPFGRNLAPARRIRDAIRAGGWATPVIVAGGVHAFDQAERILTDGNADVVGFARQALADPDWFRKVRSGLGAEVRLCQYTNYCEGLDQKHKPVTCHLWDREALDAPGALLTPDGRRRAVAPDWRPERAETSLGLK